MSLSLSLSLAVDNPSIHHFLRKQLYCALTNRYINRKPAEVTLHLEGRRYKQALQKCKLIITVAYHSKLLGAEMKEHAHFIR